MKTMQMLSAIDLSNQSTSNVRSGVSRYPAWLRELEQAQWQQQVHDQANNGNSQLDERADAQLVPRQLAKVGTPVSAMQETIANKHEAEFSEQANSKVVTQFSLGVNGTVYFENGNEVIETALATYSDMALAEDASTNNDRPGLRQLTMFDWPAQSMHAMVDGNVVRIWLRDTQLASSAGLNLLKQLRSHFQSLGLIVGDVTLNGQQITGRLG
jgi:hypothetical protein